MKSKTTLMVIGILCLMMIGTLLAEAAAYRRHVVVVRHGYYRPFVGPSVVVRTSGPFGRIDFDIKPNKSRVYVDGVYIGIADSYDGWPQTFRVRDGKHRIKIISPDGRVYKQTVYVQAGKELNFNFKF